jgi:hypothetical protein
VIIYFSIGHLNEDETACGYFQQDGATAHTSRVSTTPLRKVLGTKYFQKKSGHHGRLILHLLIVICGEQ